MKRLDDEGFVRARVQERVMRAMFVHLPDDDDFDWRRINLRVWSAVNERVMDRVQIQIAWSAP